MKTWIIIFCCYLGNAQEPDGQITITKTEVVAFGVKWRVVDRPVSWVREGRDQIVSAQLYLTDGERMAVLTVHREKMTFVIPGVEVATMQQIRYETYYP